MISGRKPQAVAHGVSSASAQRHPDLVISTGDLADALTDRHQVLLEFGFGACHEPTGTPSVNIPLRPVGVESSVERWWYAGPVGFDTVGPVRRATCDDFLVLIVQLEAKACEDVRAATREAYTQILDALGEQPDFTLARMWNYLGDINHGDDDLERYRQFSVGRAEAFQKSQIRDGETPVGTGIGTPAGTGLTIVGLASRRKFLPVENPLQVSAFKYPRQYGPSSPKFSRSGILPTSNGSLFLISGTAAVVGHESAFPYQTELQVKATLNNLNALAREAMERNRDSAKWGLDRHSCIRVYLRDSSDYETVRTLLSASLAVPDSNVLYLEGDICRRELMVEIEATAVI